MHRSRSAILGTSLFLSVPLSSLATVTCDLLGRVTDSLATDHLGVDVDYSAVYGTFVSQVGLIACKPLIAGATLVAYDHCD
jgi:hypothetical protein